MLSELTLQRAVQVLLVSQQVSMALALQDPGTAEALLAAHERQQDPHVGGADVLVLARADIQMATGRSAQVRDTLQPILGGTGVTAIRAWTILSAAEDQHRRDAQAVAALSRALDLTAAAQVRLPLLYPGRHLTASLRRHLELVGTHRNLIEELLATSPAAHPSQPGQPAAPLTGREMAVLLYLPTMRSNAEIAEVLCVSENTVKQHLKSIYRKLSVNSRREAVRVAREAGLLVGRAGLEPATGGL